MKQRLRQAFKVMHVALKFDSWNEGINKEENSIGMADNYNLYS